MPADDGVPGGVLLEVGVVDIEAAAAEGVSVTDGGRGVAVPVLEAGTVVLLAVLVLVLVPVPVPVLVSEWDAVAPMFVLVWLGVAVPPTPPDAAGVVVAEWGREPVGEAWPAGVCVEDGVLEKLPPEGCMEGVPVPPKPVEAAGEWDIVYATVPVDTGACEGLMEGVEPLLCTGQPQICAAGKPTPPVAPAVTCVHTGNDSGNCGFTGYVLGPFQLCKRS